MKLPELRWKLSHPALPHDWNVCGFRKIGSALDHLLRHFLAKEERWEQLVEDPSPRQIHRQLSDSGCKVASHPRGCGSPEECGPTLAGALDAYLGTVAQASGEAIEAAIVLRVEQSWNNPLEKTVLPRLAIATANGIFAAFATRKPSHMATALRPSPREGTGKMKRHQFIQAARRKLERELAASEAVARRLGKKVEDFLNE